MLEKEEEIAVNSGPGIPVCILYKLEGHLQTGDKFYVTYDGSDAGFIFTAKITADKAEQQLIAHKGMFFVTGNVYM